MKVLVVIHEFADYVKGQVIKAEDEIKKLLGSHPGHVVAADHPAEGETPAAEPAPEAEAAPAEPASD
jgi:hypothetical protein